MKMRIRKIRGNYDLSHNYETKLFLETMRICDDGCTRRDMIFLDENWTERAMSQIGYSVTLDENCGIINDFIKGDMSIKELQNYDIEYKEEDHEND